MYRESTTAVTNGSERVLEGWRRQRSWADRLLEWAEFLAPQDRALLQAIYRRGMTARQVAQSAKTQPRSVAMRVMRLLSHLNSPTFRIVLGNYRRWPPLRRRVADHIFLRCDSQRETARQLGVSAHAVRRECELIRALVHAIIQQERILAKHRPGRTAARGTGRGKQFSFRGSHETDG